MTDKELLIAAARAAGLSVTDSSHPVSLYIASDGCCGGFRWNPLADDGDALRLAVKLRLSVGTSVIDGKESACGGLYVAHRGDPEAATRRAIVRAAAALHNAKLPGPAGVRAE